VAIRCRRDTLPEAAAAIADGVIGEARSIDRESAVPVPAEGIEPPTFGLQIRPEVVDPKRIIADYWFADKPLRDMIVDVR
jgi:hypothetical protein